MLPFGWELVEIGRLLPSAPVAVIVTEAALVVCQVNVTACPEVMLLLLAEKTRVGAEVTLGLAELEPQPVKAMSGDIAANPNIIFKHVTSSPLLLSRDDEGCRSRLLLRVLIPRLAAAACNVSLLKRAVSNASIPTTIVMTPFSIPLRFPQAPSWISLAARIEVSQILSCCCKLALKGCKSDAAFDPLNSVNYLLTQHVVGA